MADGILKVGTITTSSGSGTITIPSGVSFSGGGVQNTPAFEATLSANQSMTDNTTVKVLFDTEIIDTNGCYDSTTNYRFTPTVAGKYFVYIGSVVQVGSVSTLAQTFLRIYKNGSSYKLSMQSYENNYGFQIEETVNAIIDMNGTTDYLEGYIYANASTGNPEIRGGNNTTYFGAYKLIGV